MRAVSDDVCSCGDYRCGGRHDYRRSVDAIVYPAGSTKPCDAESFDRGWNAAIECCIDELARMKTEDAVRLAARLEKWRAK